LARLVGACRNSLFSCTQATVDRELKLQCDSKKGELKIFQKKFAWWVSLPIVTSKYAPLNVG
jgi:hypothetical protein